MKKKKIPRLSGIKTRTIYRDSMRRFATRENSVSDETWTYRESIVKGKRKMMDLEVEAYEYSEGETSWFPSIKIPGTGRQAGKLLYDTRSKKQSPLQVALNKLPVDQQDSLIEVSMTGKTSDGKIVKRKISFYHFNSEKIEENSVRWIMKELFYDYGDRPAYPIKIVRGAWRKRETTKKETMARRQLYDVTFHIKSTVESRKSMAGKKRLKRRKKK